MTRRRRIARARALAGAAATFTLALGVAVPLAGAAAVHRTTLPDVEDEVMCVVCGTPLNVAQAPQADRERALIQALIDRGETKAQIKRELVSEYGPSVLALPSGSGFGSAAYLVPIAAVVLALAGLAVLVPRWRRRGRDGSGAGPAAPATHGLSAADTRRLDEDMARFDP